MLLSRIIDNPPQDVEVGGITADSRAARANFVYAALPGSKTHGRDYIGDALMHGAGVIVAERGTKLPEGQDAVLIETDNPRLTLAKMAARFYGKQPERIVAVTGTSGKTSTVSFTQQLWNLCGVPMAASLGTLGVRAPGVARYGSLTTPDTVSLHAELADLASVGITHLAMEASSHGLDQFRLDGVKIKAAAYTNLSRDHLDYHPTMEDYFTAKSRLFTELLIDGGTAVLNADDEYFERIETICKQRNLRVLSYGENGKDIRFAERMLQPHGQMLKLSVFGEDFEVLLPLVGQFQTMNALCALGLVLSEGGEAAMIVPQLAQLRGVPGRLEQVIGHPAGAGVYVDYAHKPGALEAVLNTLRPHTDGKLVCLFGCGGNRDAGKRPIMGRISAGLADLTIVTDDNPRSEDAETIRQAILEGAPDAVEIGGRRDAIRYAIQNLHEGDILVIAGKGHEQGQIVGDVVEPFDDVAEAEKAINDLLNKKLKA